MTEIFKFEARRYVTGAMVLVFFLGLFVLLILGIYPSIEATGDAIVQFLENLPEQFQASFAVEAYTTVEGFIASEFYQFTYLLLVGLYIIYLAGGTIAGDVESGRIDLLLSTPVSRRQVVVEKYLALFVPMVIINLIVPLFVYGGTLIIGESVDMTDFVIVHVLSIPYLAVAAALGLFLSVSVRRADLAQRGGLAVLFLLFVLDSATTGSEYEWIGTVSPNRYFNPTDIIVDQSPDIGGALILIGVAIGLVILSVEIFRNADV